MRLLLIEDEPDFIARVQVASNAVPDVTLLTPEPIGLLDLDQDFDESAPVEEQLSERLQALLKGEPVDLVLLDTDLSRQRGKLRTQTEYRQAFQGLGVPVCRYRKGHTQTELMKLEFIRRLAVDGASAIWVSPDHLSGDLATTLVPWLKEVSAGFQALRQRFQDEPDLVNAEFGPSGMLADLLGRPALKSDLLGYTAQNFFFFSGQEPAGVPAAARYATQLGYWLHNYVLAFPGPILNSVAAAAFVNLAPGSFGDTAVQALVAPCQYGGPFQALGPYYWKDDLATLLDTFGGDIAEAATLQGTTLDRVDPVTHAMAYYCLLTRSPIRQDEAAVNPDWIPAGASLSRIKESEFDELGPMLKS